MVSVVLMVLVLVVGLAISQLLLVVGTVGAAWLSSRNRQRRTLELLSAQGFEPEGAVCHGTVAGLATTLRRSRDGSWQLTVDGLPTDLALRTSQTGAKAHRTGDRAIDGKWSIGTVEGGIGRLGRQARLVLLRLRPAVESLVLAGGTLTATTSSGGDTLVDVLADVERLVIELRGDPIHLLVEMVRTDPDPIVRGQMLWELAQHDRALAQTTVERRDPHSSWGAEELLLMGELMGRPQFLVRALQHESTSLRLAGRIVSAWLILDADATQLLEQLARRFGAEALVVAAEHMQGRHAHHAPALLPWVTQLILHPPGGQLGQRAMVSVVRSLQEARVHEAVPALLHAAEATRGPALLRILDAIGSLGRVEDVAPLRDLQTRLAVTEFQAQRAIEQAIATIQGRISGDAGALSLAAPRHDAGMLAIVEPTGGDLAVADPEPPSALPLDEPTEDMASEPPPRPAPRTRQQTER